ncbi:hypothetical protein RYH80_19705 [Halobaculum sp. MBLA0147]|uniref:hypothetical protein n=1 Tax=Halobaculum sp. MBLA0147 TaxID=3079934 RepID=UPI003525BC88
MIVQPVEALTLYLESLHGISILRLRMARAGQYIIEGLETASMSSRAIPVSTVRNCLERLDDVSVGDHETAGFTHTGSTLNLNAVAIGLGLESVRYQPDTFPGLVYTLDEPELTVVVFGSGVLATVDAPQAKAAVAAFETVRERIDALGLGGDWTDDGAVVPAEEIPVPEPDWTETVTDSTQIDHPLQEGTDGTCSACGDSLTGGENYCPACGAPVEDGPSSGDDGGSNTQVYNPSE